MIPLLSRSVQPKFAFKKRDQHKKTLHDQRHEQTKKNSLKKKNKKNIYLLFFLISFNFIIHNSYFSTARSCAISSLRSAGRLSVGQTVVVFAPADWLGVMAHAQPEQIRGIRRYKAPIRYPLPRARGLHRRIEEKVSSVSHRVLDKGNKKRGHGLAATLETQWVKIDVFFGDNIACFWFQLRLELKFKRLNSFAECRGRGRPSSIIHPGWNSSSPSVVFPGHD